MNRGAKVIGLRLEHDRETDLPLYAHHGIAAGPHRPRCEEVGGYLADREAVVVDDRQTSPWIGLSAAPTTNRFITTILPLLERIGR